MPTSIYGFPIDTIAGEPTTLDPYRGKVLLIVNVASKCGLTPQYNGLEWIYRKFKNKGLVVLGFPANDFASQEPGSNEEISKFCRSNYAVDFPMFAKISVTGPTAHPLYKDLVTAAPRAIGKTRAEFRKNLAGFLSRINAVPNKDPDILWNFEKFLISRDGEVLARFSPEVIPEDPVIVTAVERALAEPVPPTPITN